MIEENSTEVVENVEETVQQDDNRQDDIQQDNNKESEAVIEKDDNRQGEEGTESKRAETPKKDEHLERVQNWRALREKADRAERERDDAIRALQEKSVHKAAPVEEEHLIDDDAITDGKDLKRSEHRQMKRLAQIEERLIEQQIRTQYPDFDAVVTPDTLGMLRDADPDLAESILSNKSVQGQAAAAYKSIKRFGFAPEDKFVKEKEKALSNSSKPRPVASVAAQQGDTPLSKANAFADGFTPDLAKVLYKQMQDAKKNR